MSMDIPKILSKLAERHSKTFMFRGQPLPLEKVFAYDGALYVLVQRANQLAEFLFGESLKVNYLDDSNALNGQRVSVLPEQQSFVLLMMLYDVLEELVVTTTGNEIILA